MTKKQRIALAQHEDLDALRRETQYELHERKRQGPTRAQGRARAEKVKERARDALPGALDAYAYRLATQEEPPLPDPGMLALCQLAGVDFWQVIEQEVASSDRFHDEDDSEIARLSELLTAIDSEQTLREAEHEMERAREKVAAVGGER